LNEIETISLDEYYKKIKIPEDIEINDIELLKHILNALSETVIRDLMGLDCELNVESWRYGDPGLDLEKDGVKFDVIYNPDPEGDLYLYLDKPHIADVYILVVGDAIELDIIGWAYRSDFNDPLKTSIKMDDTREILTIPQKYLNQTDEFKWFVK
jgi:hypothetical protein